MKSKHDTRGEARAARRRDRRERRRLGLSCNTAYSLISLDLAYGFAPQTWAHSVLSLYSGADLASICTKWCFPAGYPEAKANDRYNARGKSDVRYFIHGNPTIRLC
jgi:hypothetical protein